MFSTCKAAAKKSGHLGKLGLGAGQHYSGGGIHARLHHKRRIDPQKLATHQVEWWWLQSYVQSYNACLYEQAGLSGSLDGCEGLATSLHLWICVWLGWSYGYVICSFWG